MIFLENKYKKWYFLLVKKAQNRHLDGCVENHHIIPKSLGGNNDRSNLVKLTPREHAICHLMLVRMTEGGAKKKMAFAAHATLKCRRFGFAKISTRMYDKAKRDYQDARMGVPRKLETKMKQSATMTGRKLADAHKKNIGLGVVKRFQDQGCSEETREKLRLANTGKVVSLETRDKISATSRGRWWSASKTWALISPEGKEIKVENLMQFCSDHNLSHASFSKRANMTPIVKGKSKGWLVKERQ